MSKGKGNLAALVRIFSKSFPQNFLDARLDDGRTYIKAHIQTCTIHHSLRIIILTPRATMKNQYRTLYRNTALVSVTIDNVLHSC